MRQLECGGFSSRCEKILDIMLLLLFNETFYTGELMLYKNEAIFFYDFCCCSSLLGFKISVYYFIC